MTLLYILFAILLFGVLIAVHEFGHFTAAKAFGVKVEEFSIGMGPALWKKERGETLYALRAIPIGGYCAMNGEDGESDDPRAFVNQSFWKRLVILAAGSFMNFVLGFVIVLAVYADAGAFRTPIIADFMEGCPYESAEGLHEGDRFLRIDGHRVYETEDVGAFLSRGGDRHELVLKREGRRVRLTDFYFVPTTYEGYENKMYGLYFGYEEATLPVTLRCSWETTMEFTRAVWDSLGMIFHGEVTMADMSGPVGIVDLMAETGASAETAKDGISNVLYIAALIAVNLAVMNMLPIPALDGGRIFAMLIITPIELVSGKRLDPKYEGYVHAAGMLLLLGLMGVIMFNDILRIIKR